MNSTADTNALLRLILNDEPAKTDAMRNFLRQPESTRGIVELHTTTVSEIVYVLGSPRCGYPRGDIVRALEAVLALPVRVTDAAVVESAFELFRDVHHDWDDCVVAAYALQRTEGRLLSYDKQLGRIPGLVRFEPPVTSS
ncbi:MAG: PIN domain-containing protein [Anaerolineaceae bacterium]